MISKLQDLDCKYGAPMGRVARDAGEENPTLELQRVDLDAGGYDGGGAYWGTPNDLWRYQSESGETEGYLRADSRAKATAELLEKFPGATIIDAESSEGLDDFTAGYIEAALWTETGSDHEDEGLGDDGELSDIAPESIEEIKAECKAWQEANKELLALAYARGYEPIQAGRDYWLTRNGHGVGFWDRDELDDTRDLWRELGSPRVDESGWAEYQARKGESLGERLSKAAGRSECYLYRGDDGQIWFS